jgi:Tol biopolymer transport system component/predicted Ser/Thr protein kinase
MAALEAGARIGSYEILALIGAGGMGEVYRACDTKLDRDVAIKVLPAALAQNPERLARFQREAKVLASLNHRNIAAIYGVEERALVMELVEGESPKGPMPFEDAWKIATQIADALEYAHEKGVIHRDLKPANIKVTPEGVVKLLDFGLAKAVAPASAGDENSPTLTMGATEVGVILGTPAYMAPEQARGQKVDKRADIWAFGVVLYELLTGEHSLTDLERVPLQVRKLLQSCLEKDPRKRLRDIGDVGLAILSPAVTSPATRTPAPLGWIAAGVLAVAAVWGWLHAPPAEPRPVTRWTAALPSSGPVNGSGLSISRDGTRLAYAESTGSSSHIRVRMLDQPDGRPIPGTEGGLRPFFSPDGQWLAYFTGRVGPLKKVPVTGGPPITLCDGAAYYGGSWGEDDRIVFSDGHGLRRVSASGGTCESLTTGEPQKGEDHRWPQILPGGQTILFTIGTQGSFDSAQIAVLDLKSGRYRVVANGGSSVRYVPSGHLVYVRGGAMFALPFDLKRLAAMGPETPVIDGVFYNSGGGFADYSFSDSGLLVYMPDTPARNLNTLEWRDRKGTAQTLPAPPQLYGSVRLSPDGQRAAVAAGRAGGSFDIQIVELARGTLSRLTSEGQSFSPVWTPDGQRVAFSSSNSGIYWTPADGSGRPELLLAGVRVAPRSWTPDGKALLYDSQAPARIWTLLVSGSASKLRPFSETSFNESDPQVSPDRRWVAYTSDESGKNQVYARPFPGPGGKTPISIGGGEEPRWSRDGRELFYRDPGKGQLMAVDIQTNPAFRAGQPHALFALGNVPWDAASDGKRFLVVKTLETAAGEAKLQVVVSWFEELRQKATGANR